jgi:hypothetical protein
LWKELCERKALLAKYVLSEQKPAQRYTLPILSSSLEHRSFHYACQLQADWDGRTAMISKTKLLRGVEDACVVHSVSHMIYAMDFKES